MTRTMNKLIACVGLAAVLMACIEAVPPSNSEAKADPTGLEHLKEHSRVLASKAPDEKVVIAGVQLPAEIGREVIQELGLKWTLLRWPLDEQMNQWYFGAAFRNQFRDLMKKNKDKHLTNELPEISIEQQIEKYRCDEGCSRHDLMGA